jgi:hypothetical protein
MFGTDAEMDFHLSCATVSLGRIKAVFQMCGKEDNLAAEGA